MPVVYFVRHGQTDWNAAKRLQGTSDIPINAVGRAQALRNAGVLAELLGATPNVSLVASPLSRARQTMEIILNALALNGVTYATDDRLKEISFGAWVGYTFDEISRAHPDGYAARKADIWNFTPEGGENYVTLFARVAEWFDEIREDTVVVAHGGVMRCLEGYVRKLKPQDIVRLDVPQDKVLIIEGNKVSWA